MAPERLFPESAVWGNRPTRINPPVAELLPRCAPDCMAWTLPLKGQQVRQVSRKPGVTRKSQWSQVSVGLSHQTNLSTRSPLEVRTFLDSSFPLAEFPSAWGKLLSSNPDGLTFFYANGRASGGSSIQGHLFSNKDTYA